MTVPDNTPLTEVTLFILLTLAHQPKHGYAIMQEVSHLSDGRVDLGTGTLYGALKRLLQQGWIARVEGKEDDPDTGRPRKEYVLTEMGRRILNAEVARLQAVTLAAQWQLQRGDA
jgi:DNA-binding PadR family transcriptional regulator